MISFLVCIDWLRVIVENDEERWMSLTLLYFILLLTKLGTNMHGLNIVAYASWWCSWYDLSVVFVWISLPEDVQKLSVGEFDKSVIYIFFIPIILCFCYVLCLIELIRVYFVSLAYLDRL